MSKDKKDFYGKEVAEAIKKACDSLGVGQEQLDISVIETGSTGIFGLIRKRAHIRVSVKPDVGEDAPLFEVAEILGTGAAVSQNEASEEPVTEEPIPEEPAPAKQAPAKQAPEQQAQEQQVPKEQAPEEPAPEVAAAETVVTPEVQPAPEAVPEKKDGGKDVPEPETIEVQQDKVPQELSAESLEIVKSELLNIVELMGFPSTLEVETSGLSVGLTLRGEFEEDLTGAEGKVLDSLQYLLRKIASRKVPERLRISVNVGNFREKRLEELKVKAVELAAQVKEDGKTQVLPALNPSERRVIHMILQEDKEIRSRSVGDGLFKKILIYKPGKNNRSGGRKRSQGRGRQKKTAQNNKQGGDSEK